MVIELMKRFLTSVATKVFTMFRKESVQSTVIPLPILSEGTAKNKQM
jgi:hypothetical protein